jgi:hypothetical protein
VDQLLRQLRNPAVELEAVITGIALVGVALAAAVVGDVALKARTECDAVLADLHRIPGL